MKVMIFIGDGIIAHTTLNKIVPDIISIGIKPLIVKTKPSQIQRAHIPELKVLSFLESGLLSNVVEPALSQEPSNENGHISAENLTLPNLAKKYDLEIKEINDVNAPDFISSIVGDNELKGAISIRSYSIFKPNVINAFREKGFMWNLHTGFLPKYRGVFIPYHAIKNGEKEYGWTLHDIAPNIDFGDIIATDTTPLSPKKSVLETYLNMTSKGASMVVGALIFFKKNGTIPKTKQTNFLNNYFTFPTAEEMNAFSQQGIIFARDIANTYADLFTVKGSMQEKIIKKGINAAVKKYPEVHENEMPLLQHYKRA